MLKKNRGFTLIELLVVVAIIGLLATIILVSLSKVRSKARDVRRAADLRQVALALEMYFDDNDIYPGTAESESYNTKLPDLVSGGYLAALPLDPAYPTDAAKRYKYYMDDNKLGYILAATLENTGSSLLETDAPCNDNGSCSCTDPIYCIGP